MSRFRSASANYSMESLVPRTSIQVRKPQAGRYRQFLQVGAELLGSPDPHADVEIISLASRFFQKRDFQTLSYF